MDLKNIRGMEQPFIGNEFKRWVLAHGIVKPSGALKNTSKNSRFLYNFQLGLSSELIVVRHLQNQGFIFLFQRVKTFVAEVDLIFLKNNRIFLIEVKALNHEWRAFDRVSKKQEVALVKNSLFLKSVRPQFEYRCYIAWVLPQGKVSFVEIS